MGEGEGEAGEEEEEAGEEELPVQFVRLSQYSVHFLLCKVEGEAEVEVEVELQETC